MVFNTIRHATDKIIVIYSTSQLRPEIFKQRDAALYEVRKVIHQDGLCLYRGATSEKEYRQV